VVKKNNEDVKVTKKNKEEKVEYLTEHSEGKFVFYLFLIKICNLCISNIFVCF